MQSVRSESECLFTVGPRPADLLLAGSGQTEPSNDTLFDIRTSRPDSLTA